MAYRGVLGMANFHAFDARFVLIHWDHRLILETVRLMEGDCRIILTPSQLCL